MCGGSIISSEHVLTTYTCCTDEGEIVDEGYFSVVAGDITLKKSNKSVERKVVKIIFHEEFNEDNPQNNIAVIKVIKIVYI